MNHCTTVEVSLKMDVNLDLTLIDSDTVDNTHYCYTVQQNVNKFSRLLLHKTVYFDYYDDLVKKSISILLRLLRFQA